ncbi:VOC family protein [Brevibacillus fulvus]|uniref:Lactoylglutathione lyase n=1 Tax=Brevibacillus fulvus TaxID=1125967 RepID=A0A938Y4E1_9BACL|nr:VOC family protein [Brevibacillus fulvus]MBM7592094.1 lactoylglutathione lyase [Brevibacillus fulvus]
MAGKRIDHVGLIVKDIDRAIQFYQEVVGFQLKQRLVHTNGVFQLAFLGFNHSQETELEIIQGYNDHLPTEGKVHHLAIAVDNIEEEFSRLQRLDKVQLIDQEITTLPNGYRYFFFYGPEGEWIEFFQR